MYKICSKCGVEKPHAEFSKDKKAKDGFRYYCNACNIECVKKWCKENKNRAIEYRKKYYEENREHKLEYGKKYYEDNKEHCREYNKKWAKNNQHLRRANEQKRRAMKKGAAVDLTDNERLAIQLIYEDAQILGWHVDHIVPLSKGGRHHPDNLQIVKSSYNLSKSNKLWQIRKYT